MVLDLILTSLSGVAIVWTIHNKYHHEGYYRRIEFVLNSITILLSDACTVKCGRAKKPIRDLYPTASYKSIHIIRDGSYIDRYPNHVDRDEARSILNIEEEKFVYLFFGLIRPYKGVEQLFDSYLEIANDETELWIFGSPSDEMNEEFLDKIRQSNLIETELRYIPDNEIQYFMNAADVLVIPYEDILNSGTIHLGLSFGIPIIAPSIGCIPESTPEENELLYDGTATGLETEMRDAYLNYNPKEIGKSNYDYALEHGWETPIRDLCKLYRSVNS